MVEQDTLVLVDGSSYLYRAFHALPPLTNSRGEPTGAVLGVLNMLHRMLREQNPQHVAVVFDAPGKTFRDDLFAEYKAHRPAMPDDLRAQIEPLIAAVEALGLPLLRIPGVEADDVIGTLAQRAAAGGQRVLISTGDKDMAQLVTARITLVNTMTNSSLDRAGVKIKFDVYPEQIVDYLALVGDSSDNIPGVPKVGPKTAARWLDHYVTLDNLLAHQHEIEGKVGESLRVSQADLALSRQLARIRCDCELPIGPQDLQRRPPDTARLRELYMRLELRSLLKGLDTSPTETAAVGRSPGEGIGVDLSRGEFPREGHPSPGFPPASPAGAADVPGAVAPTSAGWAPGRNYEIVLAPDHFNRWLEVLRNAELVSFDTETSSLDYMQAEIVGVSFAVEVGHAAYVPLAHTYPGAPEQLNRAEVLRLLTPLLEDPVRAKVGHHLKYDAHVLRNHGIELRGMRFDAMLESYVLNSVATRHDLDSTARLYLGVQTIHYEDLVGKGTRQLAFNDVPVEGAAEYSAEDADVALRLHRALWPRLERTPGLVRLYTEIEQPLVPVLLDMEHCGVLVDAQMLKRQSQELSRGLVELEKRAHEIAGHPFNVESPKQLREVLFGELGLPVKRKTPSGDPSTAEDVLEELAEEFELPRVIMDYRGLAKLRSTYTDRLPEQINPRTGRVHTSYHQAVAATGRLSSTDPNLQNIPIRTPEGRRIRQAFLAPSGHVLIAADYSQIELRIMAHLSGDAGLLEAFASDRDIHQATAAEVFGVGSLERVTADQRRAAKAINFGLIYGMSAFGLARQLGIERGAAQQYVELYFKRYPGVRRYMDETRQMAREQGFVETVFGRRLYLPEIRSRNQALRSYAERSAINAPMQGTAADIIKRAMIEVHRWLAGIPHARLLMQVHDELVLEVAEDRAPDVVAHLRGHMTTAAQLNVPLKVEVGIGRNWDEAH
ncbi:MAG TPA: DNA polymerase I [Steroidobacteraceae bacterium]|nr:DNA polymerase I [Steroidobacteraceae bacterium]